MSRRRLECAKPLTVEEAALRERPEWNDTLRGILVALVKDRRALWDARFRTTKEKTMSYFREIADILSNQDARMNEWSVLEKWCWMMEMYMRAVERPCFEWRFKGAMAFHNEFAANGVQYLSSLTPEILSDLTLLYAETEAEYEQVKIELNKKLRKGSAGYSAEMLVYHKVNPSLSDTGGSRPKITAKRGRPRGSSSTTGELSGLARNGKEDGEGKAIPLVTSNGKSICIKEENSDTLPNKGVFEGPTIASVLEEKLKMATDGDTVQPHSLSVTWTTEMVDQLIQCVKEIPALWHYDHPQYRNSTMRKKHFSQIAEKLRSLPGGSSLDDQPTMFSRSCFENGHTGVDFTSPLFLGILRDLISAKWSALRDGFELPFKKSKHEGSNNCEHNQSLLFLTPEVMSACRFDDLTRGSETVTTSTAEIPTDVQSQIHKILGYIPEPIKTKEQDGVPSKKAKLATSNNSQNIVKTHIELDSIPHVQQVVSTWVPPREDALDTVLQSYSSTPPTATAQVTVKNDIAHILRNPSPRVSLNGSKITYTDLVEEHPMRVEDHPMRPYEDKWALMGDRSAVTTLQVAADSKRNQQLYDGLTHNQNKGHNHSGRRWRWHLRDRAAPYGIVAAVANLGFLDSCSSYLMLTNEKINYQENIIVCYPGENSCLSSAVAPRTFQDREVATAIDAQCMSSLVITYLLAHNNTFH
ncbi:hypothetical protein Y032_0313g2185 [Ancylostoma ceylanicum]|uniref:MADF domain-containing protein n=1 Tax=Ancylostoma ceylanicum TaxID=53326 RepID=A0A016S1U2_9BILA|nr:hypothetical protein Y032_0313g2185 [Ancylostoma ceylanicum]